MDADEKILNELVCMLKYYITNIGSEKYSKLYEKVIKVNDIDELKLNELILSIELVNDFCNNYNFKTQHDGFDPTVIIILYNELETYKKMNSVESSV